MRGRWLLASTLTLALGLGETLRATHPVSSNDNLLCEVDGDTVKLSWNIVFIAPILGWIVSRDGADIARLPPEATGYADEGVADGEHFYGLTAINFNGDLLGIGRCAVVVGNFGLRCAADGLQVHLAWGPIFIDVFIAEFIIRRDGVVIATVPGDVLRYTDTVPGAGAYRYTVHAESSPGHEFLIGACTVRVSGTGFLCAVDPPEVTLDWSRVPLPELVIDFFAVVRNGVIIARTNSSSYTDRPGPGEHRYQVFAVFGLGTVPGANLTAIDDIDPVHRFLVGECTIVMPGSGVPPPEELTCVDLDAPPEIADAVDFLEPHDVLLVWQKPVEYDWVLIAREFELIARIPGSQFYYVDRAVPPGTYTYQVTGVVGRETSPAAECEVSIPRPPVAPPHDLVCEFIGIISPGDIDPAAADPDVVGVDPGLPRGAVRLRWLNGQAYDAVIVLRNGGRLARLPGGSTSYRDEEPPAGLNRYAVFGVVGARRSAADECEVEVPVDRVPPPRDLVCLVLLPGLDPVPLDGDLADNTPGAIEPGPDPEPVPVPAVLLRWVNPVHYHSLVILRNDMQIATLPGDATSFVDHPALLSATIVYSVIGTILDRRSPPATCEVKIPPPFLPPPRDFKCEVLGLVLDPTVPGIAGDPAVDTTTPVPVVRLTWVNPVRYLALVLLRDDAGLARLPGSAMVYHDINPPPGHHVYTLWGIGEDGNESRRVRCEVDVPPEIVPPVEDLTCVAIQDSAGAAAAGVLRWRNPVDAYDAIVIVRDGALLAQLPGDATNYIDRGLGPGIFHYTVVAVIGNRRSAPEECRIVIGPPPRNLLYFSSGIFDPASTTGGSPIPVSGDGEITCLASNADPLQGWSFGVVSDPSVLEVADVSLEGTATAALNDGAGPDFLSLNRFENGITMAVVIDIEDPADTLPPANAHGLLRILYEPGPDAMPGGRYPVRYTNTLGEPPVSVLFVVRGFELVPETLPGWVELPAAFPLLVLRGDAQGDGEVTMTDAIFIFNWLFLGGRRPPCMEQADINASGDVNLADGIYELQWQFIGGPEPPPPFPGCGPHRVPLGCEQPTCPQPPAF